MVVFLSACLCLRTLFKITIIVIIVMMMIITQLNGETTVASTSFWFCDKVRQGDSVSFGFFSVRAGRSRCALAAPRGGQRPGAADPPLRRFARSAATAAAGGGLPDAR